MNASELREYLLSRAPWVDRASTVETIKAGDLEDHVAVGRGPRLVTKATGLVFMSNPLNRVGLCSSSQGYPSRSGLSKPLGLALGLGGKWDIRPVGPAGQEGRRPPARTVREPMGTKRNN